VTVYPRRYLSPKRFSVKPLQSKFTKDQVELDDLDYKILLQAAQPGEVSNRQLAQKLAIPASTVDLRIRKLTERGVITGQFLAIDCTKYGYQPFKLLVYGKGINPDLSAELQKFCDRHPNVVYLIECLGNWDYEIGVEVSQTEEVTRIMQEIFEEFGAQVNTIKLLTKFRDIKFRWFPGS
jgi:DNA-binding Lrp family transcriptional regulator